MSFVSSALGVALLLASSCGYVCSQAEQNLNSDSDHDGISDATEQALMERFRPTFMVSSTDCSAIPASFVTENRIPTVAADDGTIYAQVFPLPHSSRVEVHYYHLWRVDCGRMGHALDTEHVSVLLDQDKDTHHDLPDASPSAWHALYWYAAAHEDTVCDASQITRATTLDATDHGATIWISAGKHGSFLKEELCHRGCGGDLCNQMEPLAQGALINLGEKAAPMHGALWATSPAWPLAEKMTRSDMRAERITRLERLPETDIAWANPSKRPAQNTIAAGNTTIAATSGALALSDRKTNTALVVAGDHTGGALGTSYTKVKGALGKSAHGVGRFLGKRDHSATSAATVDSAH